MSAVPGSRQSTCIMLQVPSILVDETTVHKISLLTPNIGVVYSGMGPDSRVLIRKVHTYEPSWWLVSSCDACNTGGSRRSAVVHNLQSTPE